jgi:hypothetical protein
MAKNGANSFTREVQAHRQARRTMELISETAAHSLSSTSAVVTPSRRLAFAYDSLATVCSTCTSAASSSSGRSCRRGGSDSVSRRWVRVTRSIIIVGHPYHTAPPRLRRTS